MSDIKGQLIKDSYNYVLQSDLITGIVYRIGGDVPANPKFVSGLTVNANFTYSNGSEFPGFVLTCDNLGNGIWAPVSATTSGIFVTGGTFNYTTGTLQLRNSNGSQVTISGLTDTYITGGTISGTSVTFTYNDGDTFELTGITPYSLFSSYTATTQVTINNKLDISGFTAYTASTQSTINNKLDISGFTAYTATTQPLILNSVTGGTYSGGTLYLINNSGTTIPISGFTTGGTSTTDSYVTGFTLDNDVITLTQNRIDQYSAFSVSLSGYVSNLVFTSYTASTEGILNSKVDNTTFNQFAQDTNIDINNRVEIPTFTAYTATTQPLILNAVTGGTFSGSTLYLINNSGTTIPITGFTTSSSTFTGGTVSGATRFTGGLTANTISATTYQNLPSFTGGTVSGTTNFTNGLTTNTITSYGKLAVNVSTVTDGVNSYSVYASLAPGEYDYMTNGIGGYFAVDARNGYNQITNKYSLQLIDGTEGLNKVLTSVTSDGKANWSGTLNVSAVTATTITSNSVKVLPVALTVISNTASTDASLSSIFTLTLTGNTTLATPTNGFSGQRIVYRLRQDGTGNKLLTLSSGFRSGPITVTLSTAANTTDYLGVIYNEIDNEWDVLALNKGYS